MVLKHSPDTAFLHTGPAMAWMLVCKVLDSGKEAVTRESLLYQLLLFTQTSEWVFTPARLSTALVLTSFYRNGFRDMALLFSLFKAQLCCPYTEKSGLECAFQVLWQILIQSNPWCQGYFKIMITIIFTSQLSNTGARESFQISVLPLACSNQYQ